jgi:hypothetical protein
MPKRLFRLGYCKTGTAFSISGWRHASKGFHYSAKKIGLLVMT